MKILVACEFSGIVRDAFIRKGHDAYSCDLEPSESSFGPHIQDDVLNHLDPSYDLMVAHPPCTHLAVSGAKHFDRKGAEQAGAIKFALALWNAPIKKIVLENPVSILSRHIRPPNQIIQPWQFGHGETKSTCLWLKGLPLLKPTNIVEGREARIHKMGPSVNRSKNRSRTYTGIAEAIADQFGSYS